ncbi:tripartite motif-containing protein 54 [Rhinatrema bivittatum]|uniref:tripartite motif-containing protein 54 n=1 Tax=Rhinatrema bivittatum TaxID=194408 RepID=UPI001128E94E|nr:tripartite motif-containing protein 54 [Rhinatrema bivittatum]
MEALGKVLSCPVCLEFFTPPVLVLSCSHNFCKQCVKQILLSQNCTHVNGSFYCPVCRKVIHLRGKGANGLQRNILAENILEKFKDELAHLRAKEENQLLQTCEKHGEIMNLMCLNDDEPICASCKIFGDHEPHKVAKISDTYAARKICLTEDLQLVLQKSESTITATKETEKLINELTSTTEDTKTMIDTIGISLLNEIKYRIVALKIKLDYEHSSKLRKLKLAVNELEAPKNLYQQMKTLLDQHANSVQFLKEDKKLRAKMEKLTKSSFLPKVPENDSISPHQYLEELIKGIHIRDFVSSETDKLLSKTAEMYDAWRAGCPPSSNSSEEMLDEVFCKTVLGLLWKSNKIVTDNCRNVSLSAYISASDNNDSAKEVSSEEATTV